MARRSGHRITSGIIVCLLLISVDAQQWRKNTPPMFDKVAYQASIREDLPVGGVILSVTATDPDPYSGPIVYSLVNDRFHNNDMFTIDRNTGIIRVAEPLDYEMNSFYELLISAENTGYQRSVAYANVYIRLLDVNDNRPRIKINLPTSSPRASVSKWANLGTFLALVEIADPDSGRNGLAFCSSNNKMFALIPVARGTYKLVLAARLNNRRQTMYRTNIRCSDKGFPTLTSVKSLTIIVT